MKTLIVGGTSGMGRSLAQKLVTRGDQVFLAGNDIEELKRSAADLEIRGKDSPSVQVAFLDLEKPESFEAALDAADLALNQFDSVIVTAAIFASQDALEDSIELTRRLVTVNYAHTVLLCELVRKRLLARGGGSLTVFSSVAGDRGRKPVAIYGSSKAGLSVYLEGLDHKYHAAGLHVLCVKPGFVKTAMTAGLKPPPFAAEADEVADIVLKAIEKRKALVYAPKIWALNMGIIRALPRFVMRRVAF